jgi:hypothetical protein
MDGDGLLKEYEEKELICQKMRNYLPVTQQTELKII